LIRLETWDLVLLAVVSLQGTLLAYLPHPKWKALIMTLPIPFTLASLAIGAPIDATHVVALNLLLAYTHGVRLVHDRLKLPILLAIFLSAAGYVLAGALLRPIIPRTAAAFWTACVLTLFIAGAAHALFRLRREPDHRSHLPVWIKIPIVAGVILALILMKRILGGFMTMFPMVGVVASYEARTCLGSVCVALPDFMFAMVPMFVVVRLLQPALGLGTALAAGWVVFLPMLTPLIRDFWGAKSEEAE